MFDFFLPYFLRAISILGGQGISPGAEEKARLALQAGLFLIVFCILFFWFYRKQFWHAAENRRLFWWTVGFLAFVIAAKFSIFYFAKGYIPDRLLFFGIPSPKFSGFLWLLPVALSLAAVWRYKTAWESWPARKFLVALFCIFVLFSAGVAGLREGAWSISEPFTREHWEYSGALPLIQSAPQFLREYVALNSELPIHSQTHPPGYALFLYAVSKLFGDYPLALALAALALGGLALYPLYYLLRAFADEVVVRRGLALFIFLPSVVMYSATSMETALLFWSSAALAATATGWRRSYPLALAGGVVTALALMQNFLFLLFAPLFLLLFCYEYDRAPAKERPAVCARALLSLLGFLGVFLLLIAATGYSIMENFFVARAVNISWVGSNFASLGAYFIYLLLNLLAFSLGLGITNFIRLFGSFRRFLRERNPFALSAFGMTVFFLCIGVFQGEVERIWLFLLPLYILPLALAVRQEEGATAHLSSIALSIAQIVVLQTIFYTYW